MLDRCATGQRSCEPASCSGRRHALTLSARGGRRTARSWPCRALSASKVLSPPDTYDFRAESQASTLKIVADRYPQLQDLVDEGTLIVVPRSQLYVERRDDGYREPEEVFLVGTAHLSRKSADDVRRVVDAVRPENVVVEVCKSRSAVLYMDDEAGKGGASATADGQGSNPMTLSGNSLPSALARTLSLGGGNVLLLRALLGRLSTGLASRTGVSSGLEFAAARVQADAVGAQVVLGDRPIEITLSRAWRALDLRGRLTLAADMAMALALAPRRVDQAMVESLKNDEVVNAFFAQLSAKYPQVLGPLVHERDLYLAWSLKRSKAVNGTQRVVGVVGRGHLRGVVYALTHDSGQLRFKDLVRREDGEGAGQGQTLRRLRRIAFELAIAAGCYYAWTATGHSF